MFGFGRKELKKYDIGKEELEKFQYAMKYLIHNKIKFIVEYSTESDETTTYRIFLGGYKKKEDLTRAIEMLKKQKGES